MTWGPISSLTPFDPDLPDGISEEETPVQRVATWSNVFISGPRWAPGSIGLDGAP